jgi:hypothetical protein
MVIKSIIIWLINLSVGVVTGLYSGLVVARYQRFSDLRSQAKKTILEIDYIHENGRMIFPRRSEVPEFTQIASELLYLKHRKAASRLLNLQSEIYSSIQDAGMGRISYDNFQSQYLEWQRAISAISPNPFQLLRLFSGL